MSGQVVITELVSCSNLFINVRYQRRDRVSSAPVIHAKLIQALCDGTDASRTASSDAAAAAVPG